MGHTARDFFVSLYLKAAELISPLMLTIKAISAEIIGPDKDLRCVIAFHETDQKFVCNKTNFMTLADAYGPDTDGWIGKSLRLVKAIVEYQGKRVPGLRVEIPSAPTSLTGTN